MNFEEILVSRKDAVATVALNRPDRLNAWTPHMSEELRACFRTLSDDDGVRAIILTGEGRGFCAGADVEALKAIKPGSRGSSGKPPPFDPGAAPGFQGAHTWFPTVPKPVIAAINGPVAGLGFVLALWCDIRFASSEAIFSSAFSRRGLVAEHGISWLLPRLVGVAHAQDILLSARRIDAAEAERIGIVNRTLPADELLPHAESYARMLAEECSPRSMRIMKRQLWEALGDGLPEALAIADQEMSKSFSTNDFKEGVASFAEKRSRGSQATKRGSSDSVASGAAHLPVEVLGRPLQAGDHEAGVGACPSRATTLRSRSHVPAPWRMSANRRPFSPSTLNGGFDLRHPPAPPGPRSFCQALMAQGNAVRPLAKHIRQAGAHLAPLRTSASPAATASIRPSRQSIRRSGRAPPLLAAWPPSKRASTRRLGRVEDGSFRGYDSSSLHPRRN